jgi:hypothetical protein
MRRGVSVGHKDIAKEMTAVLEMKMAEIADELEHLLDKERHVQEFEGSGCSMGFIQSTANALRLRICPLGMPGLQAQ